MATDGIEVVQIRRCNSRGAWWNEYLFQHRYGPRKEFVANLSQILLPCDCLLTKEQVNYIRKVLARAWRLDQSGKSKKSRFWSGERQAKSCLTLSLCFFGKRKKIKGSIDFDNFEFMGVYFIEIFYWVIKISLDFKILISVTRKSKEWEWWNGWNFRKGRQEKGRWSRADFDMI